MNSTQTKTKVTFKSITSPFIKKCFHQAFEGFPQLHDHPIFVRRSSDFKSTMRAQPVFNRWFWNKSKRYYNIDISTRAQLADHIRLENLPREVLIGWFAHELGHVMDYRDRSGWNLIGFGLGYWLFPTHRIGAERQADVFAIEQGFADYLVATKQYIIEHSSLSNVYKDRIKRYYMSPEEVRRIVTDQSDGEDLRMDAII